MLVEIFIEEGPNRGERISLARGPLLVEHGARLVASRVGVVLACSADATAWVNGLPAVGTHAVRVGDQVRIGGTVLRVAELARTEAYPERIGEPPATYDSVPRRTSGWTSAARPARGSIRSRADVDIVAETPAMKTVVDTLRRVAAGDASVLLLGESGTGKEVAARAIQANGARSAGPFVAVNAAAMSEGLLESELFGHEKGAFTGAVARRAGVFELAHGGTLFLDEIGEVSPAMQTKLLRVLETGEVRRVGASGTRRFDVRLIGATNRNLRALMREGVFREDLFYRLAVVEVRIPPLRERPGDLVPLCHELLRALARDRGLAEPALEDAAIARLRAYPFPGNIRELRNILERALILGDGRRIRPEDLPPEVGGATTLGGELPPFLSLAEAERRHIEDALRLTGWNKKRAAEILEVDRKTLYLKIATFGLDRGRQLTCGAAGAGGREGTTGVRRGEVGGPACGVPPHGASGEPPHSDPSAARAPLG
jgi:DNA-binding NtrC family response regulator